mmetsp:Transcript_47258/g.78408  ORF Transcript_47258/g.78408 Transcript_47258/m.78408 type:complete len:226 (+) Transcript_47258:3183-3860(+)
MPIHHLQYIVHPLLILVLRRATQCPYSVLGFQLKHKLMLVLLFLAAPKSIDARQRNESFGNRVWLSILVIYQLHAIVQSKEALLPTLSFLAQLEEESFLDELTKHIVLNAHCPVLELAMMLSRDGIAFSARDHLKSVLAIRQFIGCVLGQNQKGFYTIQFNPLLIVCFLGVCKTQYAIVCQFEIFLTPSSLERKFHEQCTAQIIFCVIMNVCSRRRHDVLCGVGR